MEVVESSIEIKLGNSTQKRIVCSVRLTSSPYLFLSILAGGGAKGDDDDDGNDRFKAATPPDDDDDNGESSRG